MRNLQILVCLLVATLLLATASTPAQAAPSILLLTQKERIDYNYLRAIHERGFAINLLARDDAKAALKAGTLAENLKQHHAVVVVGTGGSHDFGRDNMIGLIDELADYARGGGGVLLMPNSPWWDDIHDYDSYAEATQKVFGASYLKDHWLVERDETKRTQEGMISTLYAWTDSVVEHPITKGVDGIWYNYSLNRNDRSITTPLDIVDKDSWTTLLRGSPTSTTLPISEFANSIPELKNLVASDMTYSTEKRHEKSPPILAVRELGKGRVALMAISDIPTWCDGYRFVHGGGKNDDKPGFSLAGSKDGRTSGLERLIDNALHWLSEPAVRGGALGGYTQDPSKLQEPTKEWTKQTEIDWRIRKFDKESVPPEIEFDGKNLAEIERRLRLEGTFDDYVTFPEMVKLSRSDSRRTHLGVVGARTTFSDGTASAADMIQAAKAAGLGFLIFLERFDLLTPEEWDQLKTICLDACSPTFQAIPGYSVDSNRNHSMFIFGKKLDFLSDKVLTDDRKKVNFASKKGAAGLRNWINYVLERRKWYTEFGYYNFSGPAGEGELRDPIWNLRLYDAIGLSHYDSGRLLDRAESNIAGFRDVNDHISLVKPYSINIVRDPKQLKHAVANETLTQVWIENLEELEMSLRYAYRSNAPVGVGFKDGPLVRGFDLLNRDYSAVPLRSWVTPNYRYRVRVWVESKVGLDEILIWDGNDDFRRFQPNGAKVFDEILELSHGQQRQLVMVATDRDGRKTYSNALQNGNHAGQAYWCSDRINFGWLYHGPSHGTPWSTMGTIMGRIFTANGYDAWHGTQSRPWASQPGTIDLGFREPRLYHQTLGAGHPFITLYNEDARIVSQVSKYGYPKSEAVANCWNTYGPLIERQHLKEVGYEWEQLGDVTIVDRFFTGNVSGQVKTYLDRYVDTTQISVVPGNRAVLVANSAPGTPLHQFNLPDDLGKLETLANSDFRFRRGGFIACYSTIGWGGVNTYFLDDHERKLVCEPKGYPARFANYELFPANLHYEKNKRANARMLQISRLRKQKIEEQPVDAAWFAQIQDWLGLDGTAGYDVVVKQGKQMPPDTGFCDIDISQSGYADLHVGANNDAPLERLGIRLRESSDRWSMWVYRPKLATVFAVGHFTRNIPLPHDREDGLRPLGAVDDIGYLTVDLPKGGEAAERYLAGHPVVASDRRVYVTTSVLAWNPYRYVVAVNNPTNAKLDVELSPAMPLPNFNFVKTTVSLNPGERREVFRNGE